MNLCPITGKPCLKPRLFHITEMKNGTPKSFDLCDECMQTYMELGESPELPEVVEDTSSVEKTPGDVLQEMLGAIEQIIDSPEVQEHFKAGTPVPIMIGKMPQIPDKKCPNCGLSLIDLRKKPLFGCPKCYEAFAKELEPILWHTHGMPNSPEQLEHLGKKPKKFQPPPPPKLTKQQQVIKLKYKMAAAVKNEDYEGAAILRDAIKELEEKELDE